MSENLQSITDPKFAAFVERQNIARSTPGNCVTCGKPNSSTYKTCDKCRQRRKDYHVRKRWAPIDLNNAQRQITEVAARVDKLERLVNEYRVMALNSYDRGYHTGRRYQKKTGM